MLIMKWALLARNNALTSYKISVVLFSTDTG